MHRTEAIPGSSSNEDQVLVRGVARHEALRSTHPEVSRRLEDRQFLAMERAFAASGGLACDDEVLRLLRRHVDQPLATLARWIVARDVISFLWKGRRLMPRFQFDLADMSLRPEAIEVSRELARFLDNWDLARWFAQPNVWLADQAPVEVLRTEPQEVLEAAHADRLVACRVA
jgi:hypothetical protein